MICLTDKEATVVGLRILDRRGEAIKIISSMDKDEKTRFESKLNMIYKKISESDANEET